MKYGDRVDCCGRTSRGQRCVALKGKADDAQKWNPTTLDADSRDALVAFDELGIAAAAIFESEMDDVLDARIAVGERWLARLAKIFCLSARDSLTACIVCVEWQRVLLVNGNC